jgi:hypothetical protein
VLDMLQYPIKVLTKLWLRPQPTRQLLGLQTREPSQQCRTLTTSGWTPSTKTVKGNQSFTTHEVKKCSTSIIWLTMPTNSRQSSCKRSSLGTNCQTGSWPVSLNLKSSSTQVNLGQSTPRTKPLSWTTHWHQKLGASCSTKGLSALSKSRVPSSTREP